MTILTFLVELAGATMLLLYAVRMVRTGIERAFGSSFRRVVTTTTNPLQAAATGVVLAVILQSSAAVALLVSGFAGTGALGFSAGLSIVLGADLGSALVIQILSFKLDWLVPLLLAIGGGLFIKSTGRKARQAGRILMGVAFILISLQLLRQTMDPIRHSAFLPAVSAYLAQDFLTAFLVGAALAFVMHSSVAAILMCVTLVGIGALPVDAGTSLILGANFGSALIPIWLSRGLGPAARRIPYANLFLRGTFAIFALLAVNLLPVLPYLGGAQSAQTLVNVHILFNVLLLLALPTCKLVEPMFVAFLPSGKADETEVPIQYRSVLDDAVLDTPPLALASLKREVLRMEQVVESMMMPVMDIYRHYDKPHARSLREQDDVVNKALDDIRHYAASLSAKATKKADIKAARDLTEYAISLETAGDIVVKKLLPLAEEKSNLAVKFSKAGWDELNSLHERVMSNTALAANVLVSDDLESARLLLEEKSEMTRRERSSRKKHLKRLSGGAKISFDSSDIHLETLRALKNFNSQIAAVAYPILYRGGQLLETRLITGLDKDSFGEQ